MRVLFFKEQEGSGHPLFSCFLFGRFLPTNSKLFIEFTAGREYNKTEKRALCFWAQAPFLCGHRARCCLYQVKEDHKIMANNKKMVEDITSMEVDFAKWYTDIVKKAELCLSLIHI